MAKNILIDRHHAGLFRSLELLGGRLGWEVYTPVGFAWWDEDYWTFGRDAYGDARLRDQYLDTNDAAWTEVPIRRWVTVDPEYPSLLDSDGDEWAHYIYGVELQDAREVHWDYVMPTVQDNQLGFHRFATEVGAKYLYQVGNTGQQVDWTLDPIALVSSEVPILGRGVRYHQEMDPVYHWREPGSAFSITSFINFATHNECWSLTPQLWHELADYRWALHGGGMPHGVVKPAQKLAKAMGASGWALHDKVTGDGFGHVLWGWAATGRPLLGHASHYKGKLGSVLWRDMETCIDFDKHSIEEVGRLVREISNDRLRYEDMCHAIHQAYLKHYDPEADARAIADLLGD